MQHAPTNFATVPGEALKCVPTKARERARADLLQLSRPDAGFADSRIQQFDPCI
jgi:hypothetical protein